MYGNLRRVYDIYRTPFVINRSVPHVNGFFDHIVHVAIVFFRRYLIVHLLGYAKVPLVNGAWRHNMLKGAAANDSTGNFPVGE